MLIFSLAVERNKYQMLTTDVRLTERKTYFIVDQSIFIQI